LRLTEAARALSNKGTIFVHVRHLGKSLRELSALAQIPILALTAAVPRVQVDMESLRLRNPLQNRLVVRTNLKIKVLKKEWWRIYGCKGQ
jgi:superfamily II DNA helicase RecQ